MTARQLGEAELDVYPGDWVRTGALTNIPSGELDELRDRNAGLRAQRQILGSVDEWSPFVSTSGQKLRVSCSLEPIVELKSFHRIGFRMTRKTVVVGSEIELTPSALAKLSVADVLRIDLATIERGLGRLRVEEVVERTPSLIIPVTYSSLMRRRGRAAIATALERAGGMVQHGVICEVRGVEGLPRAALHSAVSLIRPFVLFVVGNLAVAPPKAATVAQLKGAGLQALSLEYPHYSSDRDFPLWARESIDAAKTISRSVIVYRAPPDGGIGQAAALGATHASFRGL